MPDIGRKSILGDEKLLKDKLHNLDHRVLALEAQGIPLENGGLAALIKRIEFLEGKVSELERKLNALEGADSL